MANKKTNKYVQTKKAAKPQVKATKKATSAQKVKKVEAVKKQKAQTTPQKTVLTKKVSIKSIPQEIVTKEEAKTYTICGYTIKKTHAWIAAAVVVVLLCILF